MKNIISKIKIKNPFNTKNINPHEHWKILLNIFFVLIIILIIISFYLLYEVRKKEGLKASVAKTEKPVLINEKLLTKITEYFDNKNINQQKIKDGLTSYKDPSI
jgi:hypothetical protein